MLVEGYETIVYPRGSIERKQTVSFAIKAWQAIGGQSAGTSGAMKYLLKQLEELASNRDMQPAYIQWTATADPAALLNASELHDGWYIIDDLEPDYARNVVTGLVQCRMTVTEVAPQPPRSVAMGYTGAALSSSFTGTSQTAIGFPLGAGNQPAPAVTRTGGEGSVPLTVAPSATLNPLYFTPSATISSWFLGGCHVYDTLTVGGNAVPTGGTFTNANWLEVFYTDHDFTGDCIITNGLLLLRFQAATAHVCTAYLWSTAQTTPGWLNFATLDYNDNAANAGTLRSYSLVRVGTEEAAIQAQSSTSAGNHASMRIRLGRGMQFARVDFRPLTQGNSSATGLQLTAANNLKIVANDLFVSDVSGGSVVADKLFQTSDYGYSFGFTNNSAQPFGIGLLWATKMNSLQPALSGSTGLGLGGPNDYDDTVIGDNPIHYYHLNESSGTIASDSVTLINTAPGTYVAAPTLGAAGMGDGGTAVTFNGTTQDVTIAATTNFPTGAQPWSIEAWAKYALAGDISVSIIAAFGDNNVAHGCPQIFFQNNSGTINAGIFDGTTIAQGGTAVTANSFHHVVGTYDGVTLRIYLDGVLQTSATSTVNAQLGHGRIAARNSNGVDQQWFKGTIDEVAFYNYTLTAAQILTHYNSGALAAVNNPAQNQIELMGFYAMPIGTTTTTTDKFQAEAEGGALGTGWTTNANSAASGGSEAKFASGGLTGNADLFGTAFQPPAGTYLVAFRVKVTANTSTTTQMSFQWWDSTAGSAIATTGTGMAPTSFTTGYQWYLVTPTPTAAPAGHNVQFRCVSTATATTDWFVDQACLIPVTLSAANTGAQEIWQQFLHDRSATQVRP